MDRLGSAFRPRGAAAAAAATTGKQSVAPFTGKFKLQTLPPFTRIKAPTTEAKLKAAFSFLKTTGASASAEKQTSAVSSAHRSGRFLQPLAVDRSSRKSAGFSFLKLPSKSKDVGPLTSRSLVNEAPAAPAVSSTRKLLLTKVSTKSVANKPVRRATEADTAPLFKLQATGGLPFTFRADTKSSAAKKRKATEAVADDDEADGLVGTSCRVGSSSAGFRLKGTAFDKDRGKRLRLLSPAENVGRNDSGRSSSSIPFALRMGGKGGIHVKADDDAMPKKRRLLLPPSKTDPALKKSKGLSRTAAQPLGDTKVAGSGRSSDDCQNDSVALLPNLEETSSAVLADATKSKQSSAEVPLSPSEDQTEEDLAMNLLCIVDDDKEDEFLTRAAAVQDFTDRVGLEQKQILGRLRDVHANISETLLDALTDLLAEEGGIGIDKLACDINIDVDIGDVVLQDDEIQVFL
ncbi:unnamed protein product [Hyaloperonospora brassicae]|uniref:Calmodulin n=1 Tax=Hyaloperonospora brassicae TaxID=162125 RepID=A0AAV0U0X8_HYABA|nr:unnamed protein product [Hyaloperonospora brassicae]